MPAHANRGFHRERNFAGAGGECPVAVIRDGHVDRFPFLPRFVPGDLRTHDVPVVVWCLIRHGRGGGERVCGWKENSLRVRAERSKHLKPDGFLNQLSII